MTYDLADKVDQDRKRAKEAALSGVCTGTVRKTLNLELPCLLPAGHKGAHRTLSDATFQRSDSDGPRPFDAGITG